MDNAVSVQTLEFLYSALFGMALGAFYDVMRVLRAYTSGKRLVIGIFDAVFWIFATLSLFVFILTYAGGHMRWYILFGVFSAVFIYRAAVGEIVYKLIKETIDLMIKILSLSTHPLYRVLSGMNGRVRRFGRKMVVGYRAKKEKKGRGDGFGNKKEKETKHFS